jgi:hypothetical protein
VLDKQSVIKYLSEGWLGRGTVVLVKDTDLNMFYLTRVIQTKEVKDVYDKVFLWNPEMSGVIELPDNTITIEDSNTLIGRIYKNFTPAKLSEAFFPESLKSVFNSSNYGQSVWTDFDWDPFVKVKLYVNIINLRQEGELRFGVIESYIPDGAVGSNGRLIEDRISEDSFNIHPVAYGDDLDILSIDASTGEVEVTGTTYDLTSEEEGILANLCN